MSRLLADALVALLIACILAWVVCSFVVHDVDPVHWGSNGRFMLEVLVAIGFVAAFLSRRSGPRRYRR